MAGKFVDLTGQKFNNLTVKRLLGKQGRKNLWLLECDCGREVRNISERFKKEGVNLCECRYEKEFFRKVKEVHGDLYDYSKTVYNGSLKDVLVICKVHGEFLQNAQRHSSGQGCSKCTRGSENIANKDKFIGNKYYNLTVIGPNPNRVSNKIVWDFLCDCGNVTTSKLDAVIRGKTKSCGCLKKISHRRLSTAEFINRSEEVHDSVYDYSKSVYKDSRTRLIIGCQLHGDFLQSPQSHFKGSGCPKCSAGGYTTNDIGSIYILYSGDITKVGITNKGVNNRISELNRKSGYDFELVREVSFKDGNIPKDIEYRLLKHLRSKYKTPTAKFHGRSECFLNIDRRELLEMFSELVEEYNDRAN